MILDFQILNNKLFVTLSGDYISVDNEERMQPLLRSLNAKEIKKIEISAQNLGKWDSSLVVILFQIIKLSHKHHLPIQTKNIPPQLLRLLELATRPVQKTPRHITHRTPFFEALGQWGLQLYACTKKGGIFLNEVLKSIRRLLTKKAVMRKIDFLFSLEDCTWRAIGIVSLISFLVGLILAFVGALQLKLFGAQVYVASLVTIAMTRIMGAIMMGIIMAGRTGASYAATLGTMQVNEEIDALKTMGIAWSDFLVLPRLLALVLAMPFLTMWADFMGMLGGGFVSILMLDIVPQEYIKYTLQAFNMTHFWVGIFHGLVFGCVIALCGCYYGIHCGKDANSVGIATTHSVVSAIVWMIVMTGIITLMCEVAGI